jgi:hypothetical protein
MFKEFVLSLKNVFRALPAVLLIAALLGAGSGRTEEKVVDQEIMPTEEVMQKLTEVVGKITPFAVRYEPSLKILAFIEELEGKDKAGKAPGTVGELQAHLDRMDPRRITYEPYAGAFPLLIHGEPLAGRIVFHCREGERCVRRGFRDASTPALVGEESDDATFRIDILDRKAPMGDLRWLAALVQHLVTISSVKVEVQRAP